MVKWRATGVNKKINKVLDIVTFILVLGTIIGTVVLWVKAPDMIPNHYNELGEVESYISKNSVFLVLGILLVVYLPGFLISKYPDIYSYVVKINDKNRESQYNMAATFVKVLNLEIVMLFAYIQLKVLEENPSKISIVFMVVPLIIIFGTLGIYIRSSLKKR